MFELESVTPETEDISLLSEKDLKTVKKKKDPIIFKLIQKCSQTEQNLIVGGDLKVHFILFLSFLNMVLLGNITQNAQ